MQIEASAVREDCHAQDETGSFYSQIRENVDLLIWGILAKNTNEECFLKNDSNICVITSLAL